MPALQPIVRKQPSAERPFRSAAAQPSGNSGARGANSSGEASPPGKNGYGGERVPWSPTIASSKWTGHAAPQDPLRNLLFAAELPQRACTAAGLL